MPIDNKEISKRVRFFKNMDPTIYEQLIRLMDQRVTEITVAVTEAPPDQILVAQGRAQEARKMLQLFTELPDEKPASATRPGP